jgi:beta-phosphoglucomutase-like phosphatase (HAD superfamily)
VGLEAAHCLVIEDSLAGVRSAKSAGMWAIGVPHSYTADELRSAGADAVARNLDEITPGWVRNLFQSVASP